MKTMSGPKPRNSFLVHARFKRSGAHQKTVKAQRKAAKQEFKKKMSETDFCM